MLSSKDKNEKSEVVPKEESTEIKEENKDEEYSAEESKDNEYQQNELLDFIQERLSKPTNDKIILEGKSEDIFVHNQLARSANSGDFVPNEFARTMTLADSNISKAKEMVANMDWSVNKKGYRQRLISQKFEPEHNNEIWLLFKLNRFIEIKEIQIGFTNFWTVETEVYIEPSSVIIEAGMTEDEMSSI